MHLICWFLWLDRWEKASWTDHKGIDDFTVQNIVILDVFKFVSFLNLKFLMQYPRKVSVINANVRIEPIDGIKQIYLSHGQIPNAHIYKNLADNRADVCDAMSHKPPSEEPPVL